MLHLAALLTISLAVNASPEAPKPKPVLLKAARLFDGKSDALVTGGVAVLVEGEKIVAVGKNVSAPAGATVVDLGDATLMPGLMDAHTHLTFESSPDWWKDAYTGLLRPTSEQTLYAAHYAKRTLEAGFTTVRDLGSGQLIDVGLRNAINDGIAEGPRMLVCAHALGATGGHMDSDPYPPEMKIPEPGIYEGICNGADACRQAVREQVKFGADVIKIAASGGVLSLSDDVDTPQLTDDELHAIVDEAHRLRRKVAAHCHGDGAAKAAVKADVDSIEHGSFLKADTLALMKQKGVTLVPTLMTREGLAERLPGMPPHVADKARAVLAAQETMFHEALKQGVRIVLGTDSAVQPHGNNAHELQWMVKFGMSPAAALRAGTSGAAQLLGVTDRGVLEVGKLADIIAVPGDALADITATQRVSFVMKGGEIVKR
ncbi:MAG: amidohydrolase family protein [Deltaproteobacteria bacterium]|nr:amidohydrolase family protein [Deltaproteobacteria bacterium]